MKIIKFDEIGEMDLIRIRDSVLADDYAVKNMSVRNIYKTVQLIASLTDVDLEQFRNESGSLSTDDCYEYLIKKTNLYKEFAKGFGKRNLEKIDTMIETRASERLYELYVVVKSELDERISQINQMVQSTMGSLDELLKDPKYKKTLESVMRFSTKEDLVKAAGNQVRDDIAKKKAEKKDANV